MAEWRFWRGWSEEALAARLAALEVLERNFDPEAAGNRALGWRHHASETVVARERTGPPEPHGAFARARAAVARYEFSDPRIVTGHFDPAEPLAGRRMLLEMKALGFRFLAGTVVGAVREESTATETVFGFRYDTLRGHIERGWEWFLVTKAHPTGDVRFRIAADWQPGEFPNWWSRIGFGLLGIRYQRRWTGRAHARLRRLLEAHAAGPSGHALGTTAAAPGRLLHEGPETIGNAAEEER
ncbi:MAG: DUF1990 family protein [Gemmatimonadota bacterium]